MICPYNRKSIKQAVQTSNDLDDNGITKATNTALIEEYVLMECPQEGCGAWFEGKCNYNQGCNG